MASSKSVFSVTIDRTPACKSLRLIRRNTTFAVNRYASCDFRRCRKSRAEGDRLLSYCIGSTSNPIVLFLRFRQGGAFQSKPRRGCAGKPGASLGTMGTNMESALKRRSRSNAVTVSPRYQDAGARLLLPPAGCAALSGRKSSGCPFPGLAPWAVLPDPCGVLFDSLTFRARHCLNRRFCFGNAAGTNRVPRANGRGISMKKRTQDACVPKLQFHGPPSRQHFWSD